MSKLSDRLAEAKTELGISTRRMVEEAAKGGYSLSNHSASVYTSGKHPERPDPRTLEALSYVLRVPLAEVRELAGLPQEAEPFAPHPSSDLLTPPQRTAVNEIIRLLAEGNKGAAGATQAEDQAGSHPDVRAVGPGTPIDLAQARRVKDDPAAFGDQNRRGDFDAIDEKQRRADNTSVEDIERMAADRDKRND